MSPEEKRSGGKAFTHTFEETAGVFRMSNLDTSRIIVFEKGELDREIALLQTNISAVRFKRSDYGDIDAFFQEASKDYDSDLVNPYWAFTHDILKFILTKFIMEHFQDTRAIRVFDAGAGTGNWSRFVLSLGVGVRGIMFDMNANMPEDRQTKTRSGGQWRVHHRGKS